MKARRSRSLAGCIVALALAFIGCSNSGSRHPLATQPVTELAPAPSTPAGAVRLLQWCWNHRDLDRYNQLLTEDFVFDCAASDTAGNAFRGHGLTRFDETEYARHLFVGGGASPPAKSISLQFDPTLIAQQDARPGKQNETYHSEILTSVVLKIQTDDEDFDITGAARFYLVRGDSALIPADLAARGFQPDSSRWYIERWEDETAGSAPSSATLRDVPGARQLRGMPARQFTWCDLKTLYR